MNKSIKNNAQAGFTLIELIVVIVILGILAATALPKFSSLGGDARLASLQAAKGALAATASMAKGKYLVNTAAPLTTLTVEGATMTYTSVGNGYPKADAGLVKAAGLTEDYLVILPSQANTGSHTSTLDNEVMIIPKSLTGSPAGLKCYIKYKEPKNKADAPVFEVTATASDCE